MTTDAFEYAIYIATDPGRLWRALTDPAITSRYWGVRFDTDWQPGSPMIWHDADVRVADPEQRVIEAAPYRRLKYTWHKFTRDWVQAHGFGEDALEAAGSEGLSAVSFDLDQVGPMVKLSVVQDGFPPDSVVRRAIAQDWPAVLSSLKTLLETGQPLPNVHDYET